MLNINLNILNVCTSTNDIAFNAALSGEVEGTSYLAHTQTEGRGRNQNKWTSSKGNLFLSTIIKPKSDKSLWHQLSVIVGFSIVQVLVDLGVNSNLIDLKWPNDVLVDNKKISGVLLESSDNFIIVGIGLNILKTPILETKWGTTKLKDHLKGSINIKNIGLKILNKVFYNYYSWEKFGFVFFKEDINKKMFNINKNIIINVNSKSNLLNGVFLGIGDSGGIKVKTNSKITEYLSVENFTFV
ncbi:biotin--[acetyl-CoA-carboxylase] ligase [Alphaproteobacteria bacterium]|nr:biotin--[acetyl-CoA-carboxylase] ligase [Alphaproteobacteria bacterium]MDA7546837.1 biotin--[acetyl-CoA-carboxylase] ligase [Alphaproteobacteria bacterium]